MSLSADRYKSNPLFRLLAFLDNTGTQTFELAAAVDTTGNFVDAANTFRKDSTAASILSASLTALRDNIRRLFTDAVEQRAIFEIVGTGEEAPQADVIATAESSAAALPLPVDTEWSRAMLQPLSLAYFSDDLESGFPLNLHHRLCNVLGILPSSTADGEANNCSGECSSSGGASLAEQFIIDGIDEWVRHADAAEIRRIVRACGVQPTVVEAAFESRGADEVVPATVVDFIIDIIYPPSSTNGAAAADRAPPVQDWLVLSYEKNRESISVAEDTPSPSLSLEVEDATSPEKKRQRTGDGEKPLDASELNNDEELLTSDNIDEYMMKCPQKIPKSIIQAKRKSLKDPAITAFELEHHYSAVELKSFVKEELGCMKAEAATVWIGHLVAEDQLFQAAKATRKAQFIDVLLKIHGPFHNETTSK